MPISTTAEMYTCDVIYRRGEVMCQGFGSTKRQAERNAGVVGLKWLKEHPELLKKEILAQQKQEQN